jgi:hypothetical protein
MADGLFSGNSAQAVDDVVAGDSAGLIDYEQSVQG